MQAGKLIGLIVFAAVSAVGPCFADNIYDQAEGGSQNDAPVNAWADFQPAARTQQQAQNSQVTSTQSAAYRPLAPAAKRLFPKTSKRTNTNLSWSLPPTVTCSMTDLSLVDGTPTVDEAGIIDDAYDTATLLRERAEVTKDRLLPDQ